MLRYSPVGINIKLTILIMHNICARVFITGLVASILVTGCIPKKKWLASQSSLAKVRTDSTNLADKVTELQADVNTLTKWNSSLQEQLDKTKLQLETTTRDAAGKIASQQSLLLQSKEQLAEEQKRLEAL